MQQSISIVIPLYNKFKSVKSTIESVLDQSFEDFEIKDLPKGNKPNNYGKYQGSMSNHDLVYKNIIDVLQNNAPISASGYEGMKTVEIIEKLYNSNEYK